MPKQFDATLKTLLEVSPVAWPQLFHHPAREVDVIDSDISTVTGAADKVLRVHGDPDWIQHLEFQAGPDRSLPRKLNVYNSVLEDRHGLLVRTGLILLRPEANLRILTGRYECRFPEDSEPYRVFRYDMIRIWELPVEQFLSGGIGLLPLAPISNVPEAELPFVLKELKKRFKKQSPTAAKQLWTSTYVLMGLRYEEAFAQSLLREVMGMEESVTYQAIIAKGLTEGALQEARKIVLRQGRMRFGVAADKRAAATIESMRNLEEIEALIERTLVVESWEELLGLPAKRSRRKAGDS